MLVWWCVYGPLGSHARVCEDRIERYAVALHTAIQELEYLSVFGCMSFGEGL